MLTFALKKKRTPSIAPKRHTPTVSPMTSSLHLQQAKVRRILRGPTLQPKLTIGQPNDKYEQEADRVADEVMRMPEPGVQRQVEPEEEEEETRQESFTERIAPLIQRQVEAEKEIIFPPELKKEKYSVKIPIPVKKGKGLEKTLYQIKLVTIKSGEKIGNIVFLGFIGGAIYVDYQNKVRSWTQSQWEVQIIEEIYHDKTGKVLEKVLKLLSKPKNDKNQADKSSQTKLVTEKVTPLVQKQAEEEEEETLQTKEGSGQAPVITTDLESRIQSLKGGSQPLPESVRAFFEPRFSYDFSQVRIHSNPEAAEMARSLNAKAFTTGWNIVLGPGQYAPDTTAGKKLLAHELTHVMQQTKTRPTSAARTVKPFEPNEMVNYRVPKTSVEIDGSSTTKVTETVVATQAITPGTTSPIATQRRGSTPGILPKEETKETEEKWPLGWYRRYASDEQAVELFEYWVEGHGDELVLQNEKWKKYMMNNKLLERQIIKKLTTDALTRKRMLEIGGVNDLYGKIDIIRFHAEIENGYRTGYELLHGTNEDVGDFEIEGNFVVKKDLQISNAISVHYELGFAWNDIEDPLKGHFTDEMAAIFFELFSDYNPKSYTVRIRWKANALIKIAAGRIWGGILKEKNGRKMPSFTFGQ